MGAKTKVTREVELREFKMCFDVMFLQALRTILFEVKNSSNKK